MHQTFRNTLLALGAAVALLSSHLVVAQSSLDERTRTKLEAAMAAESRPQRARDRDANRKPLETLGFFGFRDDMTVLELVPGGGWYTRLLMPTLADEGKLYLAIGTSRISRLSDLPGFEEAEVLDTMGFRDGESFSFGVDDVDLALTFRNMHNFSEGDRMSINRAVFESLKPGGHYGVVDHTRRHMQVDDRENGRRVDPVRIIKEVQAAGFEFVDYSDLHYRLDDELRYEVGRRSVAGNTDRFTLLFRKPQ